ncbi:alkylhydroperoxidase domain protein [Agromyces archimandritae]|uniref:Alkylhydroperoxidase domain protein n=1 Tax=Agromyces archimandritae TaxID=2781962 RepID=A0A975FKN1_9MICO|nr:alkylhydroperoxidase domain protein [Agromyces archimandritae]QTX03672.1 alkylhydroperoxidase domain protein [Agromyces archimandritae]
MTDTAITTGTAHPSAPDAAARVLRYDTDDVPRAFTQDELGWRPWLEPADEDALTEEQWEGLVDRSRAKSDYFRLLVRDPAILRARTLTDKDVFYNAGDGLPRAERELAAAATSRVNGCIFCASVHARFASHRSKRPDDVQRLLDTGVGGEQDARWRAVIDAAAALAATPPRLNAGHLAALTAAGFDEQAVADVIHSSAFFNWANRLMLSLGEPVAPAAD